MQEALQSGIGLEGVEIRHLDVNQDPRGSFTEFFCKEWGLGIAPTQWSVVRSVARSLRGMYFHARHDEYFCVLQGRACVGLYDLRKDSTTQGQHSLIELEDERLTCLVFPRGIVHGWYFYEPSIHLQAVSESYVSYRHDDNLTCSWADLDLGIPWPDPDPLLSERAASAGSLKELAEKIESGGGALTAK